MTRRIQVPMTEPDLRAAAERRRRRRVTAERRAAIWSTLVETKAKEPLEMVPRVRGLLWAAR